MSETHRFRDALAPFPATLGFNRIVTGPILRIDAETNHAMKRGIRPIAHARDVAMLDRIEMDVIGMAREVGVVAQRVLPIAPLPDAAFAARGAALRNALAWRQVARKTPI